MYSFGFPCMRVLKASILQEFDAFRTTLSIFNLATAKETGKRLSELSRRIATPRSKPSMTPLTADGALKTLNPFWVPECHDENHLGLFAENSNQQLILEAGTSISSTPDPPKGNCKSQAWSLSLLPRFPANASTSTAKGRPMYGSQITKEGPGCEAEPTRAGCTRSMGTRC